MAQDNPALPSVPELPTWEKIKAGIKGFVKTAIAYLPRGLAFLGLLYGGSALLGSAMGGGSWDFLGVSALSGGDLAGRIGLGLLFGGVISGGMGAYEHINAASTAHQANHGQTVGNGRSPEPESQPHQQVSFGVTPPSLPMNAEKAAKMAI